MILGARHLVRYKNISIQFIANKVYSKLFFGDRKNLIGSLTLWKIKMEILK